MDGLVLPRRVGGGSARVAVQRDLRRGRGEAVEKRAGQGHRGQVGRMPDLSAKVRTCPNEGA